MGTIKTGEALQAAPFQVSFCGFQEMGGKTPRNGESFPWAMDMPEVFLQLQRLTRDRFVVMGPTTFKALSNCTYGKDSLLFDTRHSCFVLTKKKDFSLKEYPVSIIKSLKKMSGIWQATYALEKIKHEEKQVRLNVRRQQLIQQKELTPQDRFFVQKEPRLEKAIVAIGGPLLYKRILDYADTIHMFLICENFSGDTVLPPVDESSWEQDSNSYREYPANKENRHTLLRVVWKRKDRPPRILF